MINLEQLSVKGLNLKPKQIWGIKVMDRSRLAGM
jgi:hypothetical protein